MPTYEYICPLCRQETSVVRSIHEDSPGYTCKNCNVPLNQVISNLGLSFKGSGWAHKE